MSLFPVTILLCQGWGWGLSGQRPDIDTVLFNVCDMGCMCKTTKWRLKPFWVRVLCLLHCLQHWLHGLATLVTNFVGVGPIFKISAAKCISSFWKDYWYYSCYPYYSYYRNKSPTSIRAINPSTPLIIVLRLLFTKSCYAGYVCMCVCMYVCMECIVMRCDVM